jgi:[ribosomal protein S5]-alanine N-acetyltransferase
MSIKQAFAHFPELKTERLILRKLQSSDASKLYELYQEAEVTRYLDWSGTSTEQEAKLVLAFFEQQFRSSKSLRWAIAEVESNALIGTIVMTNFRKDAIADIGYDLARPYWGKGLMKEALTRLLEFCDDELNLLRLQAYIRPENIASAKLVSKLGFLSEGLLRRAGYHESRNEFFDVLLYARVQENWEA